MWFLYIYLLFKLTFMKYVYELQYGNYYILK